MQRRAGAQKHPLRARRGSLQRRRAKAVLSERQEKRSADYQQKGSDADEEEEAVLARLMPSTWQRKSVCGSTTGEGASILASLKDA